MSTHPPVQSNFIIRLLGILRNYRRLMGMSIVFGILFAFTTLIPPLLIRRLILWLTEGGGSSTELFLMSLLLMGVYLVRGSCRYGYGRFSHVVAYYVLHDLMTQVYEHLQKLSHRFYNEQRTGSLISRSINDIESIEDFVAHGIPETVLAIVIPTTMFAILCLIDAQLALIVILPLPIVALILYRFSSRIRNMWRTVRGGIAEVVAQVQDNLAGMTEIKSFGQEAAQVERVARLSAHYRDSIIKANNLSLMPAGFVELTAGIGIILAVWIGGSFALEGQMHVADLFVFIMYLGYIYQPFLQLSTLTDVIYKAASSCERIFELLDVEPEIVSAPGAIKPTPIQGHVAFQNVSFAYDDQEQVLHHINFEAEAGQMVALVGATGAGKSTVMSLVQRFYDPQNGAVFIDNHDLRDLDLAFLRQNIAAVMQDVFLFHGTVRQNILFGRPQASEADIRLAAQAANAEAFILAMPDGYDTVIGERGVRLSGGQKQRISIARALLKDAPILILDEATSAVDGETEWLIQQALSRLTAHRTTLVIAHRLSTIAHADQIIVLDAGHIVERGSHSDLMDRHGHYTRMVQAQDLARTWHLGQNETPAEAHPLKFQAEAQKQAPTPR